MTRLLFRFTAVVTTVFVITILAMIAMLLGDPIAPVNIWFNLHGGTVLTVEVLAIVVLGLAAMIADRRETRQAQAKSASDSQDSLESLP
jgi:ABC-type amino acid transport system permease subunit